MQKLLELQKKLNEINSQILNMLVKRNHISKKIGKYKKEKHLSINNSGREKEVYKKLVISAEKKNLDKSFVKKLFELILKQSKMEQQNA